MDSAKEVPKLDNTDITVSSESSDTQWRNNRVRIIDDVEEDANASAEAVAKAAQIIPMIEQWRVV